MQFSRGGGIVYEIELSTSALYAVGFFDRASSAGSGSSARERVAKFDLVSGDPVAGWAPSVTGAATVTHTQAVDVDANDECVYFGGNFLYADGEAHASIARASVATGAVDHGFAPSADDGQVWAIGADPAHGVVQVGGTFSSVSGVPGQNGLSRLDLLSGDVDLGFVHGLAAYSWVEAIFFDSDESMCVAGFLGAEGGVVRFLRADGQHDPWFNPQVEGYVTNMRDDEATRSLIVSGAFNAVGGLARKNLAAIPAGSVVFMGGFE